MSATPALLAPHGTRRAEWPVTPRSDAATKIKRVGHWTMGRTVLVVDDEHFIVDLLAEVLSEEGYAVRRAYDGEAALREIDHNPPDLVLSDVAMPRVNGLELARHVQDRGIPVILMSAAVSDPRTPGVGFITKPFDLDHILEMIADHLDE